MAQLKVDIDDQILEEFLDLVYLEKNTNEFDVKNSLEIAILEYISKNAKSQSTKEFAKNVLKQRR